MYDLLVLAYGQPKEWVGAVGAIVFSSLLWWLHYARPIKILPRTRSLDLFEIGYILEPEEQQKVPTPVHSKHHLYNDAVAILVSLGYKKTESKTHGSESL